MTRLLPKLIRELLLRRRLRRWVRWYAANDPRPSWQEPWLGAGERKHTKEGRL